MAVLHTWNHQSLLHPHIHMVVPGGGLDEERRWIAARAGFLVSVKALARLFAGCFIHRLDQAVARKAVRMPSDMKRSPSLYLTTRDALQQKRWVVYAKPPFGGPEPVLRYLARYTHRVAIGNSRLVSLENDYVTFRFKKRSSDPEWKTRRLPAVEFLRRFTLHVLPPGFVRIRYFGILAHRNRRQAVATIREQLGAEPVTEAIERVESDRDAPQGPKCPHCDRSTLVELRPLVRDAGGARAPP